MNVLNLGQDTDNEELNIAQKGSSIGTFFLTNVHPNSNIEILGSFYNIRNKSELKTLLKQLGIYETTT